MQLCRTLSLYSRMCNRCFGEQEQNISLRRRVQLYAHQIERFKSGQPGPIWFAGSKGKKSPSVVAPTCKVSDLEESNMSTLPALCK